jgi:hypothetical protein
MTIEQLLIKINDIIGPDITYEEKEGLYFIYDSNGMAINAITPEELYKIPYHSKEAKILVKHILNTKTFLYNTLAKIYKNRKIIK